MYRLRPRPAIVVAAAMLILAAIAPVHAGEDSDVHDVKVILDLPYYSGEDADPEKHKLNLFIPQGVAFAAISYRLSRGTWLDPALTDGVVHPAHAIDCARAFAWLYANADEYGFDKRNLFISGYSCGAHLAALLVTDPRYLADEGLSLDAVRAAIPIAGAYDMEAYYQAHLEENGREMADGHVLDVFGRGEGVLADASPTNYLASSFVPMLVVSELDTYDYTRIFEERVLEQKNEHIEFLHVRDRSHATLYSALQGLDEDKTRQHVIDYIKRTSREK